MHILYWCETGCHDYCNIIRESSFYTVAVNLLISWWGILFACALSPRLLACDLTLGIIPVHCVNVINFMDAKQSNRVCRYLCIDSSRSRSRNGDNNKKKYSKRTEQYYGREKEMNRKKNAPVCNRLWSKHNLNGFHNALDTHSLDACAAISTIFWQ